MATKRSSAKKSTPMKRSARAKAKRAPARKSAAPKKKAARKPAPKKSARPKTRARAGTRVKAAPKKKAALKKVAKKKATTKRSVARKPAPARRTVRTQEWPAALPGNEVHVDVGAEQERPMPKPPARPPARSFLRQVRTPKPNEEHPGQTAEHGASNDRPGSQPERVRHLYPNGNIPKSGSARSTQYKGKRRGNGPAGANE